MFISNEICFRHHNNSEENIGKPKLSNKIPGLASSLSQTFYMFNYKADLQFQFYKLLKLTEDFIIKRNKLK